MTNDEARIALPWPPSTSDHKAMSGEMPLAPVAARPAIGPYEASLRAQAIERQIRLGRPANVPLLRRVSLQPPSPLEDEPLSGRRVTIRSVIDAVCAKHGISRSELMGRSREGPIAICRQEAMYCLRENIRIDGQKMSLPEIGRHLGGRHHTTVLSGILRHEARMRAKP